MNAWVSFSVSISFFSLSAAGQTGHAQLPEAEAKLPDPRPASCPSSRQGTEVRRADRSGPGKAAFGARANRQSVPQCFTAGATAKTAETGLAARLPRSEAPAAGETSG